jgi:hypothetical protein
LIVVCSQRDGSFTCNSPPRAQRRSIRKNHEHSLCARSPFYRSTPRHLPSTDGRHKHKPHNSRNAWSDHRHMGTKYQGLRKGKMMNTHHIHYRMQLFEAARGLACAGPVQLELELMILNSKELNDNRQVAHEPLEPPGGSRTVRKNSRRVLQRATRSHSRHILAVEPLVCARSESHWVAPVARAQPV